MNFQRVATVGPPLLSAANQVQLSTKLATTPYTIRFDQLDPLAPARGSVIATPTITSPEVAYTLSHLGRVARWAIQR